MRMHLEVEAGVTEVETGCGVTEVEAGEIGEVKWNWAVPSGPEAQAIVELRLSSSSNWKHSTQ